MGLERSAARPVARLRRLASRGSTRSALSEVWREIVKGIDVSDFSRGRMNATLKELQEERDAIKHLLG